MPRIPLRTGASALATLLLALAGRLTAQESGKFQLEEARTPASPAFVLLDVEPTAVERPNTPRALAVSLISATDQGTVIPRNYALEFAPYWLTSHRELTFDQYYHPGFAQTVLQSLSLSLATARAGDSTATGDTATSVALGLRTLLRAGKASPDLAGERDQLQARQIEMLGVVEIFDSLQAVADSLDARRQAGECDAACLRRLNGTRAAAQEQQRQLDAAGQGLKEIARRIQALDHQRVGWQIEAAAGVSARFPGDSWANAEASRLGVWLTPSYRPVGERLDFIAVGRFLRSFRTSAEASFWDVGGRVRMEQGALTMSGEFVYRSRSPDRGPTTTSIRAVGEFDYRVNRDIHVTGSFGKNYDSDIPGAKRLMAQIGVDFGLGAVPLIDLQR